MFVIWNKRYILRSIFDLQTFILTIWKRTTNIGS